MTKEYRDKQVRTLIWTSTCEAIKKWLNAVPSKRKGMGLRAFVVDYFFTSKGIQFAASSYKPTVSKREVQQESGEIVDAYYRKEGVFAEWQVNRPK